MWAALVSPPPCLLQPPLLSSNSPPLLSSNSPPLSGTTGSVKPDDEVIMPGKDVTSPVPSLAEFHNKGAIGMSHTRWPAQGTSCCSVENMLILNSNYCLWLLPIIILLKSSYDIEVILSLLTLIICWIYTTNPPLQVLGTWIPSSPRVTSSLPSCCLMWPCQRRQLNPRTIRETISLGAIGLTQVI